MMSKPGNTPFRRQRADDLARRLSEPRHFIQVVTGARQVGKTTMVGQVLDTLGRPGLYVSADEPTLRNAAWLHAQWDEARRLARGNEVDGAVLVVDEIQKVDGWAEVTKRLWDEDSRTATPLQVVLLGSAPLLVQRGLTENLAGRFETLHVQHWSYGEMRAAFGLTFEEFLYFGAYPGAMPLRHDPARWRLYVLEALIETTISRDVLLLTRVDKPALLRRLFDLSCRYSGQILSYNKMVGQLQDAGNTTTLAHYLDLLAAVGMVRGLEKFAGEAVRRRGSSPKLQVLNTALMTATSGLPPEAALADREFRGRLVESAVGAHLANAAAAGECELFYWREGSREVDFVVRRGREITAIEVKSGRAPAGPPGLLAFEQSFRPRRTLLVGEAQLPVEAFLAQPVARWLES
jgi:uncharacterized protein